MVSLIVVLPRQAKDRSPVLFGWKVGVDSGLFPGVEFLKLRVQLGLYPFIRIAPESEAEGRFVRLDGLDDGLCGTDRIARLLSVGAVPEEQTLNSAALVLKGLPGEA